MASYVAALALVFILFDGGIRLNIYQLFAESSRAVFLAVLSFTFSVAATTLFAHFLLEVKWLYSTITNIEFVYIGVVLSLLLLLVRFGAVWLTSSSELQGEHSIMGVMMIRGLAVAVLATLPMQQGLPHSEAIINLAVVIIVSTVIICTAGVMLQKRM